MPTIQAQGKTIACSPGANLRRVLLEHGIAIHNGAATGINCRGIGTCGTCAVQVQGTVPDMGWREKARLSAPPHRLKSDRRLACQLKVFDDLKLTKYDGFWGQGNQPVWTPEQP